MHKNHWIAVFFINAFFAGCAVNGIFAQTYSVPPATLVASKLPPDLTAGLSQGSRGDVVRQLQEFLAEDKEVYPEGLVTGYFGPLTVQAVKRWQEKNGIEAVGIVGPKTRAKFKQLIESAKLAVVAPIPTPSPEPILEPTPAPPPPTPRDLIKTGSDMIGTNKTLTVGPAKFYLSALISNPGRFYLTPVDPAAQIANISRDTKTSPCEEGVSARGYSGPYNVCSFTDPARYTFSEHKDAIRIFKKGTSNLGSSCYDGILLFKHSGIYGGIEIESIDAVGQVHYNYWYDESGDTNFNLLCSSTENNAVKIQLANALELLKSLLLEMLKLQP